MERSANAGRGPSTWPDHCSFQVQTAQANGSSWAAVFQGLVLELRLRPAGIFPNPSFGNFFSGHPRRFLSFPLPQDETSKGRQVLVER